MLSGPPRAPSRRPNLSFSLVSVSGRAVRNQQLLPRNTLPDSIRVVPATGR